MSYSVISVDLVRWVLLSPWAQIQQIHCMVVRAMTRCTVVLGMTFSMVVLVVTCCLVRDLQIATRLIRMRTTSGAVLQVPIPS